MRGIDRPPVRNRLDRYRASYSGNGTGSGTDRSGTCGKCSKYGRTSGREGRSEECDRISGHTWSCGIRADPVPGLPFCDSDPDRDHCGICGSRCMRASGFYTGKGSGIFGSSQLYISEI